MEAKLLTNMLIWFYFSFVRAVVSGPASADIESRCVIGAVEAFWALYVVGGSGGAVVAR